MKSLSKPKFRTKFSFASFSILLLLTHFIYSVKVHCIKPLTKPFYPYSYKINGVLSYNKKETTITLRFKIYNNLTTQKNLKANVIPQNLGTTAFQTNTYTNNSGNPAVEKNIVLGYVQIPPCSFRVEYSITRFLLQAQLSYKFLHFII